MTLLALDSVTKRFGSVTAVDGVALSVARGGAALDGRRLLALCRTAVGESAEALTVREAQTLAWPQRHSEGTAPSQGLKTKSRATNRSALFGAAETAGAHLASAA
jgi:hypothetical protein